MEIKIALQNFYLSMAGVLSPKTILWYKNRLKSLCQFLGDENKIENVTLNDLRAWRSMLASKKVRWEDSKYRPSKPGGLSPESMHCHIRACQRWFRWMCDEEILFRNPARRLEKPTLPVRRKRGLPDEDRDKILSEAYRSSARDYAIVMFLADTACRVGGIANLRLEDLELDHKRVTVREKGRGGGKERPVYLKQRTVETLIEYLKVRPASSDGHVFLAEYKPHMPLKENGIYHMMKRLAQIAGVFHRWNPHS